jgi:DNA-binding MarR family transcriptional regulator
VKFGGPPVPAAAPLKKIEKWPGRPGSKWTLGFQTPGGVPCGAVVGAQKLLATQQRLAAQSVLFTEAVARRLGVTPTDVKCLSLLAAEPHTPSRLAAELGLTAGAVTTVVDRLERAGFARRDRSSPDRREVTVHPVPERAADAIALHISLYDEMKSLVAALGDDQAAVVLRHLQRSLEILTRQTEGLRADRAS